ncbi:hypothetical protein KBD08_00055 [Candidatus Babeliales bacterium]|nr:hypothetical protein [Candidatus Babeliales bacterium]
MKKVLMIMGFGLCFGSIEAKDHGTVITRVRLGLSLIQDLLNKNMTIVNATGREIMVQVRLTNTKESDFVAQRPILKRGQELTFNLNQLARSVDQLSSADYDMTIEVFKVLKKPRQKGDSFQLRHFHNGAQQILINKIDILKNDVFKLQMDKSRDLIVVFER